MAQQPRNAPKVGYTISKTDKLKVHAFSLAFTKRHNRLVSASEVIRAMIRLGNEFPEQLANHITAAPDKIYV